MDEVLYHQDFPLPGGILGSKYVLTPYENGTIYVLYCHWALFDLVIIDGPSVV